MKKQTAAKAPVAETAMLIRRPINRVFDALADPKHTTQFWFTHSTGKLQDGAEVEWTWEMYQVTTKVKVLTFERNKRILLEWGNQNPTQVDFTFNNLTDTATLIQVVNSGFTGSNDEQMKAAMDSLGGFTLVLAGLKAWLEFGVKLNLVADRYPQGK
ncbi:polyketide cyclase [Mucilaginibacter achroorhodeus]|uniref:Polyketide cyclase n=1 Tax=Mucilaginibacter achroorhodeus TaxID=2599294 RepID=A0A563U2I1_9SPHI|nr:MULTISPECIES: SRPBCC family protein [Mucilaginibacter]QXV64053.1 SRPBCC family protein [Mucilaginibacter sp. 21P]TWR25509.1 polyketide cyclase [Mucilaginibacter achroorhodeus]